MSLRRLRNLDVDQHPTTERIEQRGALGLILRRQPVVVAERALESTHMVRCRRHLTLLPAPRNRGPRQPRLFFVRRYRCAGLRLHLFDVAAVRQYLGGRSLAVPGLTAKTTIVTINATIYTARRQMTTATADGRHRRSQESRQRIIDAIVELVNEGVLVPTAEQVSDRAGLAMRTVFRHFKDMDSLYREISRRMYARVQAAFEDGIDAETWQATLHNLIDRRSRLHEELMPMRLAADALRHRSPFLQEDHRRFIGLARGILHKVLPDDLAKNRMCFEALDALFSFDVWIRLRRDQQLSAPAARRLLHQSADAQLAAASCSDTH
jgi:AcrR family transcriptional regulator